MISMQKTIKYFYIALYLGMAFSITRCSPVSFSAPEARESVLDEPVLPDEDPVIPDDENPVIPDSNVLALKVYDVILADNDASLDGGYTVQISVPKQGDQNTVLFIHSIGTASIKLVGDSSHIKAVFLTSSYSYTPVLTYESGELFSEHQIATGIRFRNFTMGQEVKNLLSEELVDRWLAGTEYSYFATQVGDKSCHSLSYQSSQIQGAILELNANTDYNCPW